jgi:adenosylcobinamide-GDP ribazoletransferase
MLRGLVTAFRTLTIFPVPGREATSHSAALPYFPLVGTVLGLLLWLLALANRLFPGDGWSLGIAAFMLLVSVIGTRALHLDGLADLVDALGGGGDPARRLEIMKDSSLGPFGGVALILVLFCKWVAFARLVSTGSTAWLILIFAISRTMQVKLAVSLPYARSEAGTALPFVRDATFSQGMAALAITAVVALPYGPLGLLALALAECITWLYGRWCRKHIGGITGDLLGAGNELIETFLLMLAAVPGGSLASHTGWLWVL